MSIKLVTKYCDKFVREHELEAVRAQITAAHNTLAQRNGLGNDF